MIRFETEAYFKDIGVSSFFYPYVEVSKCNLTSGELSKLNRLKTALSTKARVTVDLQGPILAKIMFYFKCKTSTLSVFSKKKIISKT